MARTRYCDIFPKESSAKKSWEGHLCGECALCEPVTAFHTLSVHGRRPTLGKCPYEDFKVILSQKACKHYKERKDGKDC